MSGFSTTRSEFLDRRAQEFGARSRHVETLSRLCDAYTRRGLLPDGMDRPLYEVCPLRATCWDDSPAELRPESRYAGVSAPWIGGRYFERGICVVGMNFDAWGGLDGHWEVCRWHIEAQERGQLGKDGRFFAYGAMAYAALVDAHLDGVLPADWRQPDRRRLAQTWTSCAFLESVKCSPRTARGNPFVEMHRNCPSLLLRDELEILRPRVVLVLGRGPYPRDSVRPALSVSWGSAPGSLERDSFALADGRRVDIFCCNHPSARNRTRWQQSLAQLQESLADEPLV